MATYYQGSGGNDSNDGLSWANRFLTFQKLVDTVTGSDIGYTSGDTPAATVDFDTNAGSITSMPRILGCNSSGGDDGTIATISGASLGATQNLFNLNIANQFLYLQNLDIAGATNYGINTSAINSVQLIMNTCKIQNSTSYGIYGNSSSSRLKCVNCYFYNNSYGVYSASAGRIPSSAFTNCVFRKNTSGGARISGGTGMGALFDKCMFIRNTGDGIVTNAAITAVSATISGCVFFANTGDGIDLSSGSVWIDIRNNIFRSNGGYGLNTNSSASIQYFSLNNNCFHNNTSGAVDINSGTVWGTGNVTSNPLFVTETDGSENLNLQSGSPCKGVGSPGALLYGGTGYLDIGTLQRQEVAGGGGNLVGASALVS